MFSEEFKPVAIKIEPTPIKKNESQLQKEMTDYIDAGDGFADEEKYESAISYYKTALSKAEEINKNFYRIAEIYKKLAMAYADLRNADETDEAKKIKCINRSSHNYKQAINHPSDYYPASMSADEIESIKHQNLIDKMYNYFLLARLYLVKQSLNQDLRYVYKAFNYAVKGLELAKEIANSQNKDVKKSKNPMSKEEHKGFDILDDCLNLLKNKKEDIPYYEQAIKISEALKNNYPHDSYLQLTLMGYEAKLKMLRRLPEMTINLPEKVRREASFGNEDKHSHSPSPSPLSLSLSPHSLSPSPSAPVSIFTFLKSSPRASTSSTGSNKKEEGNTATTNSDSPMPSPLSRLSLSGN